MHHVALGARNVGALAAFYAQAFDLRELERHLTETGELRSVWLQSDGVVLMIERSQAEARQVDGIGRGPFLLAFSMPPAGRAESEERVLAAGGQLETRSEASSYFRDPEGNRCALSAYEFRQIWPERASETGERVSAR